MFLFFFLKEVSAQLENTLPYAEEISRGKCGFSSSIEILTKIELQNF